MSWFLHCLTSLHPKTRFFVNRSSYIAMFSFITERTFNKYSYELKGKVILFNHTIPTPRVPVTLYTITLHTCWWEDYKYFLNMVELYSKCLPFYNCTTKRVVLCCVFYYCYSYQQFTIMYLTVMYSMCMLSTYNSKYSTLEDYWLFLLV